MSQSDESNNTEIEGVGLIVGKTIKTINSDNEAIVFVCEDGDTFEAYHMQDCCESVEIYDIDGDLQSLVGQKILATRERTESQEWPEDVPEDRKYDDSFTWTTHVFCVKGRAVTVRWLGISNGYYSESVYFERIHKPIQIGGNNMPIRTTRLFVSKTPMQIFDERGYTVEISDDCAGEFVTLMDGMGGRVAINPADWPELEVAISEMVDKCKTEQEQDNDHRQNTNTVPADFGT